MADHFPATMGATERIPDGAWNTFFSTPAGKALDLRALDRGDGHCAMLVPCAPVSIQAGSASVHPGAIVVLSDQCLGGAASGEHPRHLVTLDLRLDWFGSIPPQVDIHCRARSVASAGRAVFVQGSLTAGPDGPLVASTSGQFLVGASAGGFSQQQPGYPVDVKELDWPSFEHFLALRANSDNHILDPAPHRIGSLYLPALHGGITAATLQQAMILEAATWRPPEDWFLLSSSTQFLNAGAALHPVIVRTRWIRRGKSVALIHAKAMQPGGSEPVAVAQATFVTRNDLNHTSLRA